VSATKLTFLDLHRLTVQDTYGPTITTFIVPSHTKETHMSDCLLHRLKSKIDN